MEIVVVNLQMPHSVRRRILPVAVEAAIGEGVIPHHDSAIIITINRAVAMTIERVVLYVEIQRAIRITVSHTVCHSPRWGIAEIFDGEAAVVPSTVENIVRKDHAAGHHNSEQ